MLNSNKKPTCCRAKIDKVPQSSEVIELTQSELITKASLELTKSAIADLDVPDPPESLIRKHLEL